MQQSEINRLSEIIAQLMNLPDNLETLREAASLASEAQTILIRWEKALELEEE